MRGQWENFKTHNGKEVLVFDGKYTTIPVLEEIVDKQMQGMKYGGPRTPFVVDTHVVPVPGFVQPGGGQKAIQYLVDLRGLDFLFESTGLQNKEAFLQDFIAHGYTDLYVRPEEMQRAVAVAPKKKRPRVPKRTVPKGSIIPASLASPTRTEVDMELGYSYSSSLEQEDLDEVDLATLVRINNNNNSNVTPTKKLRPEQEHLTLVSATPLPRAQAPAPTPARVSAPAPAPSPVVATPKPIPARAPGPVPAPHPVRASVPAPVRAPSQQPVPAPHPVAVQKKKTNSYDPEIMQEFVRANEDKYRAFLAERLASTMSMADMTALLKKGQN